MTALLSTGGRTIDEVWSLTLPEVGMLLRADRLARDRDLDTAVITAWLSANYANAKKLPNLRDELPSGRAGRAAERKRMAAEWSPERIAEMVGTRWTDLSPNAVELMGVAA